MAEGGGLLNRYTLQRRIEGSNPSVSARLKLRFRITARGLCLEINPRAAGGGTFQWRYGPGGWRGRHPEGEMGALFYRWLSCRHGT